MVARVLLAYDGSKEGGDALLQTVALNEFIKADVRLLAVAPPSPTLTVYAAEGYMPIDMMPEELERYQSVLDEGIQKMQARGFHVEGLISSGDPVTEICRVAEELDVDLIIIGHRRNRSLVDRWWHGSVGAGLLEQAPCSVLIAVEKQKS